MATFFWCIIGLTLLFFLGIMFFPEQMSKIFEGIDDEF